MIAPKLRFSEFKNEWNIKQISELATLNPKSDKLPNQFIYIDLESVENGTLISQKLINLDDAPSRAQRKLEVKDVLFQMVRPYQQNNFFFDMHGNYVASTGYIQIRTDKNNPKFIYYVIHTKKFLNNILLRCTGSNYPAINSSDFAEIEISYPPTEEQTKIAEFLSAVDDKISQLSRQLQLLNEYKKGVMQKIFSQEIRFKNDSGEDFGEWETLTLGKIGVFKSGIGFPEKFQGGLEGIPFYKVSDMNLLGNDYEMKSANNYVDNLQVKILKAKIFEKKSIIFAKVGAAIFLERKRIAVNFLIDNNMMAFTPSQKNNLNFIKYIFDRIQLSKYAQTGALPSYNASDLSNIEIQLPSIQEQEKIAEFLTAIDERIDHTTAQLTHPKQWKKGLLQQMFV